MKLEVVKNTIVNIITNFYNIKEGIIVLDGENIKGEYHIILSNKGQFLSEGQKQLISIARTIMKNRTSIIIAHRLSTIYDCDDIIVLENRSIIESGSHKDLINQNGKYYKNIQMIKGGRYNESIKSIQDSFSGNSRNRNSNFSGFQI